MSTIDEYLTKAEVAKMLKVSESTIDRWRREGMPSTKISRKVLFDPKEVEKWIKETAK